MSACNLSNRTDVIELFAGAGGFTWGWQQAGFETRAAIDFDVAATRTHELNFPQSLTLQRDLTTFGPADLTALLGTGRRPKSLLAVVGGPPCQGWSRAGRGKLRSLDAVADSLLTDPRNGLYRRFLEFVDEMRPPVCVMENVPGMLSIEGVNVADSILRHYERIGYQCTVALVNARWFGVPQDRRRLIFLGVDSNLAEDVRLFASGLEKFAPRFRRDVLRLPEQDTSVRQAIGDLPEISHGMQEDPQIYRAPGRRSRYADLMRANSRSMVTDHVTREHNQQDLDAFAYMPEGGRYFELPDRFKRYRDDIFKDKYRKMRWNAPAGTVTAHFAKDCYTHIHPEQPRTVSIREAARLQSFPDDFRFFGNMGDRFRQIGNAVPPLMAWGIAEYIREQLYHAGLRVTPRPGLAV
jgi:DNA (cytosine-5)-methyltransferase 1